MNNVFHYVLYLSLQGTPQNSGPADSWISGMNLKGCSVWHKREIILDSH